MSLLIFVKRVYHVIQLVQYCCNNKNIYVKFNSYIILNMNFIFPPGRGENECPQGDSDCPFTAFCDRTTIPPMCKSMYFLIIINKYLYLFITNKYLYLDLKNIYINNS